MQPTIPKMITTKTSPAVADLKALMAVFREQDQREVLPRETWLASQFSYVMEDGGPRVNELSFLNRKLVLQCQLF